MQPLPVRLSSAGHLSSPSPSSPLTLCRSPLKSWYQFLARFLATKDERAFHNDKLDQKCLVLTINLPLLLSTAAICLIFPFLPWTYVPPLLGFAVVFMVGTSASLVHMVVAKHSFMSHFAATWWLELITCAAFWSFGGIVPSAGFILMPFMAPNVSFFLDKENRLAGPLCMFALASSVVVARMTVDLALGTGALTPVVIRFPDVSMVVATTLTIITCSSLSFGASAIMLRRLQQRAAALQRSMQKATEVAQMIVDWELDAVPKASGDNDVADLVVQVAERLKLYRPYLPAHLFTPAEDDDLSDADEVRTVSAPSTGFRGSSIRVTHPQLQPRRRSRTSAGNLPIAKLLVTRSQGTVPQGLGPQTGTMLSVRITQMDEIAASLGSVSYDMVQRAADSFARLSAHAARETKGMLQTVIHDHCLILWNVLPKCAQHVVHGLMAALMIRKAFKEMCTEEQLQGLTVSMGLWSGTFVCGTLSLGDMMSHACLGQGCERAVALQQYAAMSGRGIICNSLVFDSTKAAPKHRLLPVDVLSFNGKAVRGEIVYESVCELESGADEWMYQLHTNYSIVSADEQLRRLLQQVQDGTTGTLMDFESEVMELRESQELMVSQVANSLWAIARHHLTAGRYHRNLRSIWPIEPPCGPRSLQGPVAPWPQFLESS